MKKVVVLVFILLLVLLLWWLLRGSDNQATFSGTLNDAYGKPVAGAQVSVGDQSTVTDEEGVFHIKGKSVDRDRWVLEAHRPGFAPISKIYHQGSENTVLTTVETTVLNFDPSTPIIARDVRTDCIGSAATGNVWEVDPLARFPRAFDANGDRVTGELPEAARRALDYLSGTPPCNSGFQVSIPANSLVGASGQSAQGQVQVELSTIDLFSPDGMPGDYTVVSDQGPAYMESFGAGTIEVRSGDEIYQLKKGAKAELVIPIDRAQIDAKSEIPRSIPLLRYEGKTGKWKQIGEAKLDPERLAYVGEVDHFTPFNADVVKTNPACLRFNTAGVSSGTFDLVITAPTSSGGFKTGTKQVQPNTSQAIQNLHAVYNLPANSWVVLRAIKSMGEPIGTWVLQTGAAWATSGTPSYDYQPCGTIFALSDSVGTGVTHNGSGRRWGPLPKHVAYLVNTSGTTEDVYPLGLGPGGGSCDSLQHCWYVFSLFDTGANVVKIDGTLSGYLGISWLAGPSTSWDVDVRINGFGALNSSLFAPYTTPGTASDAQAHSNTIRVAPRNDVVDQYEPAVSGGGFLQTYYILAGTPVTNKVLAKIDYTATPITKGPWNLTGTPFNVTAPDIEFYQPGASGIPSPTMNLFLEGFGSAGFETDGDVDQRHFLQNVTFTNGANTVFDDQTPSASVRFLYDTATTFTAISPTMATNLGISTTGMNAADRCSSDTPTNFRQITKIEVVGMNTTNQLVTYTINNAEVCVDIGNSVIITQYPDPMNPASGKKVDAVIGSNLFDQAKVLWNGPERTLGILP